MSHDPFDKLVGDPRKRAIIASAYPFLKQFPNYTDFFETWNFQSLNDFALHDIEGTVVLSSSKFTALGESERSEILTVHFRFLIKDLTKKSTDQGKMFWGEVNEFDQSWRDYAEKNPNIEIMFMKFEDFIKDKKSHIEKLADFIGFKNPNIEKIIENSTLEATINRRKAKWENAGCKFWEIVCYRKVRVFK